MRAYANSPLRTFASTRHSLTNQLGFQGQTLKLIGNVPIKLLALRRSSCRKPPEASLSENLSQAQIEALLDSLGAGGPSEAAPPTPAGPLASEALDHFGDMQDGLWGTIAMSTSEGANREVTFTNPMSVSVASNEVLTEFAEPLVSIQFSFSAQPNNTQAVLIPVETAMSLAAAICESAPAEFDENTLADLRPVFEGIVQGMCIAAGQAKNEIIAATGLAIHFNNFAMPDNLRATAVVRTQVAVGGDGIEGTLIWLIDPATAYFLLNETPAAGSGADRTPSSTLRGPQMPTYYDDEADKVARMLDIPLELDVELARIKMLFKDAAELATGSIVEMEKALGELVDVLVCGRLVARGEVVVVDDYFGVRITEILDQRDRLTRELAA